MYSKKPMTLGSQRGISHKPPLLLTEKFIGQYDEGRGFEGVGLKYVVDLASC